MADNLSTIGSIASFIVNSVTGLPAGISGNMITFVDLARQYVSQYTGQNIGSNSIPENYQAVITDFAMSNMMSMVLSQPGGTQVSLGELSINEGGQLLSAAEYRTLGEMKLKLFGRKVSFARSLS